MGAENVTDTEPRRGHRLLIFLTGIVLGAVGALLAPRLAGPYMPVALAPEAPLAGQVVDKRVEPERVLLRVSSGDGLLLAIFTTDLEEVDLLVSRGDSVELRAGYEPLLRDPVIARVRRDAAAPVSKEDAPPVAEPGEVAPGAPVPGVHEEADSAREEADSARETYQREMAARLEALEAEMTELRRRADQAGAEAGEALRAQLAQLDQQRAAVRSRLDALRAASGPAWADLKDGLDRAWAELRRALEQSVARFDAAESEPEPDR